MIFLLFIKNTILICQIIKFRNLFNLISRFHWRRRLFYSKQQRGFGICYYTTDKQVLEFIQEIIGFGKVVTQSAITSRYVTQNKKEINIIVSLFNGNLVLPKRQETFDLLIKGFNKWVTKGRILLEPLVVNNRPNLPTLNDALFAGFTDGEGCFTCSIGEKTGFSFNFNISQKWEINLTVLKHFSVLFKNGIVSRHSEENTYELRLGGVNNCKDVFSYYK